MERAVTREEIREGLLEMGVQAGDALLAHSSLRSFGWVEGGADAVIDALLEAVGPEGTVLVPTLTFQVLKETPCRFSVRDTPSTSGLVTEVFRNRAGALRSLHPVSSAAALGRLAEYLTQKHTDTPCGATSPYGRLVEQGGKVVFLGAPLGANSLFHRAEEIASPAYLGYAWIENAEVVRTDGSTVRVTARRYDCADRGVRRYLGNMESVFLEEGLLQKRFIGKSRVYLIRARDNVDCSVRVLRERPEYILRELRES